VKVEQRAIADLKVHPANYNRHSDSQIIRLADSLRAHGQQKPIVIQADGTILAGHGLVEAAKQLGWTMIDCHVYDGEHPEAFIAADNYLATLAEPDEAALGVLLTRLREQGDLLASGYYEGEFEALRARLAGKVAAKEPTLKEAYLVVIQCEDELQQLDVLRLIEEKGWKARALLS
jgi:ParB-like chromosome segregation protein Spo0J